MQNFEILKAALKIQVFWDTMLYQLVHNYLSEEHAASIFISSWTT